MLKQIFESKAESGFLMEALGNVAMGCDGLALSTTPAPSIGAELA